MVKFIGPERMFSEVLTGTVEECIEFCMSQKAIAVDLETTGLDPFSDRPVMLQLGNRELQWSIDVRSVDMLIFKELLESESIQKVFHNAKFDLTFLLQASIVCENVACTMLMEQVLNGGLDNVSSSLQAVLERRLKLDMDKYTRTSFIGITTQPFTDAQIIYGALDVEYLLTVQDLQLEEAKEKNLSRTIILENNAVLAFAEIEHNGIDIDEKAWLELDREHRELLRKQIASLDDIILQDPFFKPILPKYIQGDMFDEPKRTSTEWSSPKQVLKVMSLIDPSLEGVSSDVLTLIRKKHPIIPMYMRYKELGKVVSSYGQKFLESRKSDGKIHTRFKQILSTGRVSSSEPNMQQIPGDNRFRNCFTAPEGYVFVSSDYANQELNVIAYGSQDPVWLQSLRDGHDLHSVCAELVYGEKWNDAAEPGCVYALRKKKCKCKKHQSMRKDIKEINFGLSYGIGADGIADALEISQQEAKKIICIYFQAFPSIEGYLNGLADLAVERGYSTTFPPFFRRRYYPGWRKGIRYSDSAKELVGKIGRAAKNHPIQGTSADITKLAMVLIRKSIRKNYPQVKMVMTVHDQIDTICPEYLAEEWSRAFTVLMEYAANIVITNKLLKADTSISDKWQK
jgi:DNA polymerase-1